MIFNDLREFISKVQELGEGKIVEGADTDLEIGMITEWQSSLPNPPLLLFDRIKGHKPGYRVVSNLFLTHKRIALAMGLPVEAQGIELVRAWREKVRGGIKPIPPVEVETGPVKENIRVGDEVNLFEFPVPKWHQLDGGKYIGSGSAVITRDPEEGWVNLGTYRVQVHDKNVATIYMVPGRHGELMRRKYFARGQSCPAAVSVGQEPVLWSASSSYLPWGLSEYDYTGGFRGKPVEVTRGVTTDLPIPANAEIVLEGEIIQAETRVEGPFGEWTGYYASAARPEPVFKVKSILHRNNPIIQGNPPLMRPHALGFHIGKAALLWDELDRQMPGVKGVWYPEHAGYNYTVIISLEQKFEGHAKQAAMGVPFVRPSAYPCRYVIVVDEDIDPCNMNQVLWALATRCDPERDIDIIRGCFGDPLDPTVPPEKRERGELAHSIAIMDACRPYPWRDKFSPTIMASSELLQKTKEKWGKLLQ